MTSQSMSWSQGWMIPEGTRESQGQLSFRKQQAEAFAQVKAVAEFGLSRSERGRVWVKSHTSSTAPLS